jgi:hypothetical protein
MEGERVGVKIERPKSQHVGILFQLLMVASLGFVLFTGFLLGLEMLGLSMPEMLSVPVD